MNVPVMIGVCGGSWEKPGVGKTTVVNILAKQMQFYPISFIDPVKDLAKQFFGWDGSMNSESRILLDRICRLGRSIAEDYWMNLSLVRAAKASIGNKIIFDDVWFANEAKMIIASGGIVVRVKKNDHNSPVLPCETLDIDNNGSLVELQRTLIPSIVDAMEAKGIVLPF